MTNQLQTDLVAYMAKGEKNIAGNLWLCLFTDLEGEEELAAPSYEAVPLMSRMAPVNEAYSQNSLALDFPTTMEAWEDVVAMGLKDSLGDVKYVWPLKDASGAPMTLNIPAGEVFGIATGQLKIGMVELGFNASLNGINKAELETLEFAWRANDPNLTLDADFRPTQTPSEVAQYLVDVASPFLLFAETPPVLAALDSGLVVRMSETTMQTMGAVGRTEFVTTTGVYSIAMDLFLSTLPMSVVSLLGDRRDVSNPGFNCTLMPGEGFETRISFAVYDTAGDALYALTHDFDPVMALYRVEVVADGTTATLYLNGASVASAAVVLDPAVEIFNPLEFGAAFSTIDAATVDVASIIIDNKTWNAAERLRWSEWGRGEDLELGIFPRLAEISDWDERHSLAGSEDRLLYAPTGVVYEYSEALAEWVRPEVMSDTMIKYGYISGDKWLSEAMRTELGDPGDPVEDTEWGYNLANGGSFALSGDVFQSIGLVNSDRPQINVPIPASPGYILTGYVRGYDHTSSSNGSCIAHIFNGSHILQLNWGKINTLAHFYSPNSPSGEAGLRVDPLDPTILRWSEVYVLGGWIFWYLDHEPFPRCTAKIDTGFSAHVSEAFVIGTFSTSASGKLDIKELTIGTFE